MAIQRVPVYRPAAECRHTHVTWVPALEAWACVDCPAILPDEQGRAFPVARERIAARLERYAGWDELEMAAAWGDR